MEQENVVGFDLDGTLIKKNSCFAFSLFLLKKRVFSIKDFIYIITYYARHKFLGFSLNKLHKKLFNRLFLGKELHLFETHLQEFITEFLETNIYPPALDHLRFHQEKKNPVAIFSNSPNFLVQAIANRLDINEVFATKYLVDTQGCLSEIDHVLDGEGKAILLKEFAMNKQRSATIAFSDSALDLAFLQSAESAICVQPTRGLKKIAKKKKWHII